MLTQAQLPRRQAPHTRPQQAPHMRALHTQQALAPRMQPPHRRALGTRVRAQAQEPGMQPRQGQEQPLVAGTHTASEEELRQVQATEK